MSGVNAAVYAGIGYIAKAKTQFQSSAQEKMQAQQLKAIS
jgi:hypothetical protein